MEIEKGREWGRWFVSSTHLRWHSLCPRTHTRPLQNTRKSNQQSNKIRSLPRALGRLKRLKHLFLANNLLRTIPPQLLQELGATLVEFDLTHNPFIARKVRVWLGFW